MAATAAPIAAPARERPPIGWCCFYPAVDVGMDVLPRSRASILSVCAGGWNMHWTEGTYDFSFFDRQRTYAERHDLRLALIQEINPVYTIPWLRERVRAAGESCRDAQGTPGSAPTLSSPVLRAAQEELVARFVAHVRATDTTRRVAYYHPGAEWWFPLNERYHPLEVSAFRMWLRRRYGSIARLNRAWGSRFSSFDAVTAPRIDMMGGGKGHRGLARVIDLESGPQHCSWSTPAAVDAAAPPGPETYAAVKPGQRYRFSASVRVERMKGTGVFLEVAWVGPNGGAPIAIDQSAPVTSTGSGWKTLERSFVAPPGAGRAWLLLKFMGHGAACWARVRFAEEGAQANMAPNPDFVSGAERPAAWSFQNWSGGDHASSTYQRTGGPGGAPCVRIEVPEVSGRRAPYRNATAAVNDWSTYWFEAGARYIDRLSAIVKRHDATRPTVTYLTMSWAYPSEWDESQRSAIAPDAVGIHGRHIDVFGMQLCSADRDPFRITVCLDLMRKYRKPLWAVDLVDFTSGVHIGPRAMERVSHSAVQHGASGIVYCAWHIPTVLDYSFHPHHTTEEHARMIGGAEEEVKALKGLSVSPDGAILLPYLPATPADERGFRNDWRSFAGWYKLLETLHRTVDVVSLREIEAGVVDLRRYPWVLVPDCPALPRRAVAALRRYARSGGRLVIGGRYAERDDRGEALHAGAPAGGPTLRLPDLGRTYAGDPVRDTHAGNTPPLFLWRPEGPVAQKALATAQRVADRAWPARSGIARVIAAPSSVRCVRWASYDRTVLYLVQQGEGAARGVQVASPWRRLTVVCDGRPATPRLRRSSNGGWLVEVPAFEVRCRVSFERGRR